MTRTLFFITKTGTIMSGESFIQYSTMLRGQGDFEEAITCIENNITEISPWLRPTAWMEAKFAAEHLGLQDKAKEFERKSKEALRETAQLGRIAHCEPMSSCGLNYSVQSL